MQMEQDELKRAKSAVALFGVLALAMIIASRFVS